MDISKSGLKFSIKFRHLKEITAFEEQIIKGIFTEHSGPDWLELNKAVLECYGFLKEMQEDEMKKKGHKIQNLQGTFNGYEIRLHEMSAEIIVDSRGQVEMVDSRDIKPY